MSEEQGGGASRTTDVAAGTSSATDVSLREYLGRMIDDSRRECRDNIAHLEKHFDEMHKHQEEQFDDAMAGIDKRFDGVNEFRNALADLSSLMATKDNMLRVEEKLTAQNTAIADRVTLMEKRIDLREGQESGSRLTKASLYAAVGVAIAGIGILVVLANYLTGT
jgi:hypothetical protein